MSPMARTVNPTANTDLNKAIIAHADGRDPPLELLRIISGLWLEVSVYSTLPTRHHMIFPSLSPYSVRHI
jgi:hypothetical protein